MFRQTGWQITHMTNMMTNLMTGAVVGPDCVPTHMLATSIVRSALVLVVVDVEKSLQVLQLTLSVKKIAAKPFF